MAKKRPKIDREISFPDGESPSSTSDMMCGTYWHSKFSVRAPFKSVDRYENVLPVIIDDMGLFQYNDDSQISSRISRLTKSSITDAFAEAKDGATELVDNYVEEGFMVGADEKRIRDMIKLARYYFSDSVRLSRYWADDYSPKQPKGFVNEFLENPISPPIGWPLQEDDFTRACEGLVHPEFASVYVGNSGMGQYFCPDEEDYKNHTEDRLLYLKLVEAAFRTIRCAQEHAAYEGTLLRNKKWYLDNRSKTIGFKPVKRSSPSGSSGLSTFLNTGTPDSQNVPGEDADNDTGQDTDTDEDTDIDEGTDTAEGAAASPKKKKSNGVLIAAAAVGAGLLFLKGK